MKDTIVPENVRFLKLADTWHTTGRNRVNAVSFTRHEIQDTVNSSMSAVYDTKQGRTIGYARVSTEGQDLDLQLDALQEHGIPPGQIFTDRASGVKQDRPGLTRCLGELVEGDVLVVWRLDRLGRSLRELVNLMELLDSRGVGFRSLCDGMVDTTTASGRLIFNIFGALAQFERQLIQERTKAGLAAARARGRLGGRPKTSPEDPRIVMAKALHADLSHSVSYICRTMKVSKTTLYRWLKL